LEVAPVAWVAAGIAGVVVGAVALRGLASPRRFAALGAALVRGAAAGLAVFAAFSPVSRSESRVEGRTLLAAEDGAETADASLTVRWPGAAPDAAAALETLRAARDPDRPTELVLVTGSDVGRGRDLRPAARALREGAGMERSVVVLRADDAPAPLAPAPAIVAPSGAVEGVPVVLTLDSGTEPLGDSEARVEVDGRATVVAVPPGARRATTPALDLAAGTHVAVATVPGRLPAARILDIAGAPRVLVVTDDVASRDLVAMLRLQGLDVADVRAADLAPEDVDRCAAIVLGPGVTGGSLSAAVAARVRAGAGLLVVGGEGRAGLSRLRGTALDALLPVVPPEPPAPPPEPPVPPPPVKEPDPATPKPALDEGEKDALRVALLLVIDTSGSMAGTKLLMAQQSAIAAAGALAPSDRVSVYAFDDDAREIAAFQDAVDLPSLYRRIAGLRADGGTNFFPALKAGYRKILEQPCGIRHVVLLTDGETRPAVFRDLVEHGASQGVTLSTIAVGDDADGNLLALLAGWGRGKMYLARDPARLPEVVTLDTRRFTTERRDRAKKDRPKVDAEDLPAPPADAPAADRGKPTEPKPREAPVSRRPHVATSAAFLAGLASSQWPALAFAETTPARAVSQVVLAWDDGAPALTLGRAGLGRVAVISAGAASADATEFRRWPAASQFLAQLVRGLIEPPARRAETVGATFEETADGRAFVRIDAPAGGVLQLDPLRAGSTVSTRCDDRGDTSIAELASMPPAGVYVGTFAAPGAGPRRTVAVSAGPRPLLADAALRVAAMSGARLVDRLPSPRDGEPVRHDAPCELPLVAGAAGLLVAEAALRRAARRDA
jgi:uncharacterized protein YegL